MSVGAGSIKRAARTAGKKENKTALPKAEENGSVKAEPEAGSETAAQSDAKTQSDAKAQTDTKAQADAKVQSNAKAQTDTKAQSVPPFPHHGLRLRGIRAFFHAGGKAAENTGAYEAYGIGQQLPVYLL